MRPAGPLGDGCGVGESVGVADALAVALGPGVGERVGLGGAAPPPPPLHAVTRRQANIARSDRRNMVPREAEKRAGTDFGRSYLTIAENANFHAAFTI
jgi:hypothetical protein